MSGNTPDAFDSSELYRSLTDLVDYIYNPDTDIDLSKVVEGDEIGHSLLERSDVIVFEMLLGNAKHLYFSKHQPAVSDYEAVEVQYNNSRDKVLEVDLEKRRLEIVALSHDIDGILHEAYAIDPGADVEYFMGLIAYDLGRFEDRAEASHAWFGRSIQRFGDYAENPSSFVEPQKRVHAQALMCLAHVKREEGEMQKLALEHLLELGQLEVQDASVWRIAAMAFTIAGEFSTAMEMLQMAAERDPSHSDALYVDPELSPLLNFVLTQEGVD